MQVVVNSQSQELFQRIVGNNFIKQVSHFYSAVSRLGPQFDEGKIHHRSNNNYRGAYARFGVQLSRGIQCVKKTGMRKM
jgi:hypothetical protein